MREKLKSVHVLIFQGDFNSESFQFTFHHELFPSENIICYSAERYLRREDVAEGRRLQETELKFELPVPSASPEFDCALITQSQTT